jgi:hypothetical protein
MKKYLLAIIIALSPVVLMGQGVYTMTYDMSLGLGSTGDYISAPSFRGATLIDGRGFITNNVSIGGSFSWHVFTKELEGEFVDGTTTLTGKQYRYINSFPVMVTSYYYLGDGSTTTYYAGGGVGVVSYEQRTEMGLYYSGDPKWHFGISPQIGVLIPMGASVDLHISLKYQQTFKSSDYDANQYLTLGVGFAWW